MIEIWKPVAGYEGLYEVSNYGRLKTVERRVPSRPGRDRLVPGKILKPKIGKKSAYHRYGLYLLGSKRQKFYLVHRLVAEAFIGPQPEGKPLVLHGDGDNQNNRVDNLRWGTYAENIADAQRHGTYRNGRAKREEH